GARAFWAGSLFAARGVYVVFAWPIQLRLRAFARSARALRALTLAAAVRLGLRRVLAGRQAGRARVPGCVLAARTFGRRAALSLGGHHGPWFRRRRQPQGHRDADARAHAR